MLPASRWCRTASVLLAFRTRPSGRRTYQGSRFSFMASLDTSCATGGRAQRWFTAGLILFFVAVSVQYSHKVLSHKRDGETASAILRWAKQIMAMEGGEDVHLTNNYPNPPIMAMILRPLAGLAEVSPL